MPHAPDAAYAVPRAVAESAGGAPPHEELVAADPIRRLGGYLIDLGALVLAALAGGVVWYFLGEQVAEPAVALAAVYGVMLIALLAQWFLVGWRGQSLGKLLCRVKIVARNGAPCGIVRGVLLRSVAPWVLLVLVYVAAGMLRLAATPVNLLVLGGLIADKLLVFSADSRRLVDRIAGTRVVAVDPPPPLPERD